MSDRLTAIVRDLQREAAHLEKTLEDLRHLRLLVGIARRAQFTAREFAIAHELASASPRPVPVNRLCSAHFEFVDPAYTPAAWEKSTLRVHISRLRVKLQWAGDAAEILSARGSYRWQWAGDDPRQTTS